MRGNEHLASSVDEDTVTTELCQDEKSTQFENRRECVVNEMKAEAEPDNLSKMPAPTTTHQTKPTDNNGDDDGLPIDRGWAWVIMLACTTNFVLMAGYSRSLGIIFVELLEVLNESATKTTLIFGVISGVYSVSALFSTQVLVDIIQVRKTVILGGFLSFLAIFLGMFATNVTYLICTHSIILGLGQSMIHAPGLGLLGQYFKKRRGFAVSVAMTGFSLGQIVFPSFVRYLLDQYGLRGTFLIMAGTQLNIALGGSLFRPIKSFRKRNSTTLPKADVKESKSVSHGSFSPKIIEPANCEESAPLQEIFADSSQFRNTLPDVGYKEEMLDRGMNQGGKEKSRLNPRTRTKSEGARSFVGNLSKSDLMIYASCSDIGFGSVAGLNQGSSYESETASTNKDRVKEGIKQNRCIYYLKKMRSSLDFSLFKNSRFVLFISVAFFGVQTLLTGVYLPALAVEMGVSHTNSALLLTIAGSLDFFSRIFLGYIADLEFVRVSRIMMTGLVIIGTIAQFSSFYTSYTLLVVFAVVYGMFGSLYQCLFPLVIIEFVGVENLSKALGFIAVCHGMAVSISHPIIGGLRDMTGTYTTCYSYIGTTAYMAAVLLLVESCVHALHRSKSAEKEEDVAEPLRSDSDHEM